MRKLNLCFLTFILSIPIFLSAQSLPDEMKISADGRMLLTGSEPTSGFYDESVVGEIEFLFTQSNYWSLLTSNYNSATGAEHDIYNGYARASSNTDIVINELMASNDATVADSAGEFDDWIELYNKSGQIVDLSGYFLSDKPDNPGKWEIPQGTMIGPNDYLIIWADEDGSQGDLHANFKLSASGEQVILSDTDTLMVDEVTFGQQTTDMGYARVPNGTGSFVIQSPTFAANNDNAMAIEDALQLGSMLVYPNPARDWVQIEFLENGLQGNVSLFNAMGQLITSQAVQKSLRFETSSLPTGMYFISFQGNVKRVLVTK